MEARIEAGKATERAQAELAALRERASALEAALGTPESQQTAAAKAVGEVWQKAAGVPSPATTPRAAENNMHLKLAPEEHDEFIASLVEVLQQEGVDKAIAAAEAGGNPHLIDDFHRVLVEYIREGLPAKGSKKKKHDGLYMTLYEATLPLSSKEESSSNDPARVVREFIGLMEQFYRGMQAFDTKNDEHFAIEIANPAGAPHTSVYIAVPTRRKELFEKQLSGLYPSIRLIERHDDYNAFVPDAATAAVWVQQEAKPIYSLRTLEAFATDPLDVLLAAFSKLNDIDEGAAFQIVVSPRDKGLLPRYRRALGKIREGIPLSYATYVPTGWRRVVHEIWDIFMEPKPLPAEKRLAPDDPRIKNIEHKLQSPLLLANIRLVASAPSQPRATQILESLQASLEQFADTAGNKLKYKTVKAGGLKKFIRAFTYRTLDGSTLLPLSALELATLAHIPRAESNAAAPELRQEKSRGAAAPVELAQEGALLGISRHRGGEREIRIADEDRLRHFYVIGQTGTGKSVLLKNIIAHDIRSGAGVCMIDPHGSDVQDILSMIPPERYNDVIYFDPGSIERPMGLNMLEYDPAHPEHKTLVVDELFGIFKKLFGAVPESMGPAFEQYFRNSALLVMDSPELGNTLLDISRIFADPLFRARKIAACKNPIIRQFWEGIASQTTGEQSLENYGPYVTNKFDIFTTNDYVRPIIAQQKSSINFRQIMDERKILLVNLSKGRIGDLNANLLGLVIVGKFLIAALARDTFDKSLPPFYLHIDEFQNFTTPSIATIFSEARKYKLSLTVAHQFIAQLQEQIRDAVFGNVGSICAFRVGATDAEFLEKQFAPTFKAGDLINVDNRRAHLKLLIHGKPSAPFDFETLAFKPGSAEHLDMLRQRSAQTYGRPRAEIEREIASPNTRQEPSMLAESGI